ncbi:hypothetical protein FOCG_17720 [Fusarium oxysporum f. sp. radicis-lycopersici 26381]|nr:hypothetical protein FOCG_17720 [Fusarium oxysporum f. sp. radicis-lycopersici 26381]
MCQIRRTSLEDKPPPERPNDLYFNCTRLNASTFLIVEHDQWGENPFIYAKFHNFTFILIDTGCGGKANNKNATLTLRDFLENTPVSDNNNKPLNPQGAKPYTIIVSHCHYDHIGGLAEFTREASCTVWASALGKEHMYSPSRFLEASLCSFVGMEPPVCKITHWADDGQQVVDFQNRDTGLIIFHTPGHTPDEIAIWDPIEKYLFVGDTAYERAPILFPPDGNVLDYAKTLDKMRRFIRNWNSPLPPVNSSPVYMDHRADEASLRRVKMACGHITSSIDAESFIGGLSNFLNDIKNGRAVAITDDKLSWVPPWLLGKKVEEYQQPGGQISFIGPTSYFEAFKKS